MAHRGCSFFDAQKTLPATTRAGKCDGLHGLQLLMPPRVFLLLVAASNLFSAASASFLQENADSLHSETAAAELKRRARANEQQEGGITIKDASTLSVKKRNHNKVERVNASTLRQKKILPGSLLRTGFSTERSLADNELTKAASDLGSKYGTIDTSYTERTFQLCLAEDLDIQVNLGDGLAKIPLFLKCADLCRSHPACGGWLWQQGENDSFSCTLKKSFQTARPMWVSCTPHAGTTTYVRNVEYEPEVDTKLWRRTTDEDVIMGLSTKWKFPGSRKIEKRPALLKTALRVRRRDKVAARRVAARMFLLLLKETSPIDPFKNPHSQVLTIRKYQSISTLQVEILTLSRRSAASRR
ncbi:unnamed protein product [Amoebophrya sp. A120]|nr:unnamed protein product [Amoebophrya sp. A120]|eukprot:GSA120T00011319001.1